MIKREKGFNSKGGDWDFLILDGSGTKIKKREKTGSCLECHQNQASKDFVYRTYLPSLYLKNLGEFDK